MIFWEKLDQPRWMFYITWCHLAERESKMGISCLQLQRSQKHTHGYMTELPTATGPDFNTLPMRDALTSQQILELQNLAKERASSSHGSVSNCVFHIFCWQEIRGWYYLLGEELGRSKHLKVASRRIRQPAGEIKCSFSLFRSWIVATLW